MLKCFSNEVHSIVTDCNEVMQKLEDKDPYKVPPELTALEGKTYIFQLHYGSDSTKEEKIFVFDKAWDITPAIASAPETADTITEEKSPVGTSSGIETNIEGTPAEETVNLPEASLSKSEKKPSSARRQLFQSSASGTETKAAKKTKKED